MKTYVIKLCLILCLIIFLSLTNSVRSNDLIAILYRLKHNLYSDHTDHINDFIIYLHKTMQLDRQSVTYQGVNIFYKIQQNASLLLRLPRLTNFINYSFTCQFRKFLLDRKPILTFPTVHLKHSCIMRGTILFIQRRLLNTFTPLKLLLIALALSRPQ